MSSKSAREQSDQRALEELSEGIESTKEQRLNWNVHDKGARVVTNLGDLLRKIQVDTNK